jgi:hypothetical protein
MKIKISIKKAITTLVFLALAMLFTFSFSNEIASKYSNLQSGYIPKEGFVPNEITAIKIAEAVWLPIYGEKVYQNKPYNVKLIKGVWIIEGTLPSDFTQGGVPYIEVQKKDGKIIKVYHSK